jgi:hypothetical protein
LEFKEKEIASQYLRMQQEVKHLEDIYRKRFHTFEKFYRDAVSTVEQSKTKKEAEKVDGRRSDSSHFNSSIHLILIGRYSKRPRPAPSSPASPPPCLPPSPLSLGRPKGKISFNGWRRPQRLPPQP